MAKKTGKTRTKKVAKDFKRAAANDKPEVKTEAGSARAEGLRLYALAGRPTKAEFKKVFGQDGPKWTWEARAKALGLTSAEECAKKFQSLLGKEGKSAVA